MCSANAASSTESQSQPARAFDDQLACAATRARHDRQAAGERFDDGVRQRVVNRRQHERISGPVVGPGVALRAREHHTRGDPGLCGEHSIPPHVRLAADDDQPHVRRKPRERPNRGWHALASIARSHQQEHEVGVVAVRGLRASPSRPARTCGPKLAGSTAL